MYDHWTSLATPHKSANNSSPNQQRLMTPSDVWTFYRERKAPSCQRPQLARSLSAISNERGEHGSFNCSVSRPQTPPLRPPSPFRSVNRMKKPLRFLLPASHPSTLITSDATISSEVITTTSDSCGLKPLQSPETTELVDADNQPSCMVPLLLPLRFDQFRNSSADISHSVGCSGQSAPNDTHEEWCHALSCPRSPPGEEVCVVPDYEDHTPKIEIIDPLESVCDSSSICCSEENCHKPSPTLLTNGSRPITPQARLFKSEAPLRDATSLQSLVDLPKLQAGPGWLAQGKDCEIWVEETLKASQELNFSRPRKVKTQRTLGVADVPRLWIKVEEDKAEEQSLHYAMVITPTKPRVVTIPRHNSSAGTSPTTSSRCHAVSIGSTFDFDIGRPAGDLSRTYVKQDDAQDGAMSSVLEKSTLAAIQMQRSVAAVVCRNSSGTSIRSSSSSTCEVKSAIRTLPHTPPRTSHRGRPRNRFNTKPIKATIADNDKASTTTTQEAHPITPPQTPLTSSPKKPLSGKTFSKRMHSSTTRRPPRLVTSASYPSHFVSNLVHSSWILSELDASIAAFPSAMLELDAPVIQHLRSCQGSSTSYKTEAAQVLCRPSIISPPNSGYSPLQPSMMSSQPHVRAQISDSPTSSSQNSLRAVFPGAPAHLLNALQATTIALNHVCEIMTSILSPISTSSLVKTRRSSAVYHVPRSPRRFRGPLDLAGIAPKARRMLGIPRQSRASVSAAHPSSKSQSGVHEDEPEESTPAEHGLKERGEKVRIGLRNMTRWLVDEIGNRTNYGESEGRAGALISALGEIVRLGNKSQE